MAALIETIELKTADALVRELLPVTGQLWKQFRSGASDPPNWLFRGQRDARWTLKPKALRPGAFDHLRPLSGNERHGHTLPHLDTELQHVLRFVAYLHDLGHYVPGDHPLLRDPRPRYVPPTPPAWLMPEIFPPPELLDMFALAQHYGIPTRLLDWSHKPLTAAYFAAAEIEKVTAAGAPKVAVWAVDRWALEKHLGCDTWNGRHDTIVAFITAPTASNPNLAAQGGLFSLVQPRIGQPVPDLDSLVESSETLIPDAARPVICKFTLPASESLPLLKLLNEHRVHAGTMYPGLRGAVMVLEEEAHY